MSSPSHLAVFQGTSNEDSVTAEFDLLDAPLAPGTTLLEASAGTGKTYTLAGIYLRLILEHDLTPREILVSTYTVPATAELRDRIRRLLHHALAACTEGETEDEFLRELFARARVPQEVARKRLEVALRAFDEAAIYTIHGFCQRILQDRAFESGVLFDAELVVDQQSTLREVADDYWRRTFYLGEPALAAFALADGMSPAELARLLERTVQHPSLAVLPAATDLPAARLELLRIFSAMREAWPRWREEVQRLLVTGNHWGKDKCRPELLGPQLALVEACLLEPSAPVECFKAFASFTPQFLAKGTRAQRTTPAHNFLTACRALAEVRAMVRASTEADFLAWARAELPRRKAQRNVVSFDDLLTQLHDALTGPGGEELATHLRQRFRAALVDEFQDTDPVQATIFRRIFATSKGWLFLIGDSKQAIYGFRGADVFAYLAASREAGQSFALGTNFRSTTPLVGAVNHLFARRSRPFLIEEIAFTPAHAARKADVDRITKNGEALAPFRLWAWEEEKLTITKGHADLPGVTAAEIARMLTGAHRLGARALRPSDFAVLTADNRQARTVHAALSARGIPAVLLGTASVFDSAEAGELLKLLAALAEPARDGLIRTALASTLLGLTAVRLDRLATEERAWEEWLLCFQRSYEVWRTAGFIQMFRRFCQAQSVRTQLLALPDGERRLTNVLHLAELLHRVACAERLSPAGVVAWLSAQKGGTAVSEEHELRLERDDEAVQVVTIHKSKGLQYAVVFCPFSWGKTELREGEPLLFHESDRALTLDLGSPERKAHEAIAERERLAEQLRLLYVALTRSRLQTHFAWGQFQKCEVSAGNWLLHRKGADDPDAVTSLRVEMQALSRTSWRRDLDALAAGAPAAIAIVDLPSAEAAPYVAPGPGPTPLRARSFRGHIARDWQIASFTSLTAARDEEQPDFDRVDGAAPVEAPRAGIHAFPRGVKAGVCLHELFEELDFRDDSAIDDLVARKLAAFGFDPEFRGAVGAMVRNTMRVPLAPGVTLGEVANAARLNELEFHFPINQLHAAALAELFGPLLTGIGRVQFEPTRGFIKGFIDLIFEHDGRFYLVDWKSNWLGPEAAAYTRETMRAEMLRHHYVLQSHLYVVALHRYLTLRLPGYRYAEHFGGVRYLFLRGLDPAVSKQGVLDDLPTPEFLAQLEAIL